MPVSEKQTKLRLFNIGSCFLVQLVYCDTLLFLAGLGGDADNHACQAHGDTLPVISAAHVEPEVWVPTC